MKKLTIVLLILVVLTTGCTKRFTDEESKKSYTSNILCAPTTDKYKEVYITNKDKIEVDIEKLPDCKSFKINEGGYDGIWSSLLVKPLAWLILKLGLLVKNYGISIMLIGLLLRLAMIPLTRKSSKMSENMNKAKPELDKLERKYKNKTDKDSTMMKSQEMMLIYKKYDISPMSGCLFAFLQLPIFFAFLEAVNRVPVLFEEKLLVFQLGTTPWEGMAAGNFYYLIIISLIILTTFLSFKNMSAVSTDEAQAKMMGSMNKFMIVFISIASFTLPTAIALYWIVSSGFTVIYNFIIKKQRK